MTWKIVSEESLGARPIYSVDDASKLIGYEGWRVLFSNKETNGLQSHHPLSPLENGKSRNSREWPDINVKSYCLIHGRCSEGNCLADEEESPSCHRVSQISPSCPCGVHSFSSLDELKHNDDRTTKYWMWPRVPVRIVHSGTVVKGHHGIKSYQATLTGILIPSLEKSESFWFHDGLEGIAKRNEFATQLSHIAQNYGLPLFDEDDPEDSPTSAQFLKQRYGL